MKRLLNAIKFGYYTFKNPETMQAHNFKMLAYLFTLIFKVSAEDRHMMTHVAYVHPTEGEKQIVSIWAGAGLESCPTKRISELLEENRKLSKLLSDCIGKK